MERYLVVAFCHPKECRYCSLIKGIYACELENEIIGDHLDHLKGGFPEYCPLPKLIEKGR